MAGTVEREHAIDDPTGVLHCFEITAGQVFASLCRVTVGRRAQAERLLRGTYLHAKLCAELEHTDLSASAMILTAHRLYLDEAESAPDDQLASEPHGMDSDWSRSRWGVALDALAHLTAPQRVALDLTHVELFSLDVVAGCLHLTHDETLPLIAASERALVAEAIDEPIREIFRHAEVWLDDTVRDSIRKVLADPAATAEARSHRRRWSTPTTRVRIAAIAAIVFLTLFIRWALVAPTDERTAGAPPTTAAGPGRFPTDSPDDEQTSRTIKSLSPGVYGTGTSRSSFVPPTPGSTGESINLLSLHLSDEEVIVPDAIIKYSNGKVGIVWHGPCNRPAARVQLSNLDGAVGLRLTTGSFPVTSCIGMPDRWVTVIETPMELVDGPILPLGDDNALDDLFTGFSEINTGNIRTELFEDSPISASALMDRNDQAWSFVEGCPASRSQIKYDSPAGALFEVNVKTNNDTTAECEESPEQRLVASGGLQFPQPTVEASKQSVPRDCQGPASSMTSLRDGRTLGQATTDAGWSTWDGCLVRDDVITWQVSGGECGAAGLRTITTASTIGARITVDDPGRTFVRRGTVDPQDERAESDGGRGLSSDAYDSGLRHDGDELWLAPSRPDAIFTVKGSSVVEWTLDDPPAECGTSG